MGLGVGTGVTAGVGLGVGTGTMVGVTVALGTGLGLGVGVEAGAGVGVAVGAATSLDEVDSEVLAELFEPPPPHPDARSATRRVANVRETMDRMNPLFDMEISGLSTSNVLG